MSTDLGAQSAQVLFLWFKIFLDPFVQVDPFGSSAVCGGGPPAGRFCIPTRWPAPPRREDLVVVGGSGVDTVRGNVGGSR